MKTQTEKRPYVVSFLLENSAFLLIGAIVALIWANTNFASYQHFVTLDLLGTTQVDEQIGEAFDDVVHSVENGLGIEHEQDAVDHADDAAHPEAAPDDAVPGAPDAPGAAAADAAPVADDHAADAPAEEGGHEEDSHHGVTVHFLVNEVLMALFFAIAAKEVWEALLPKGPLADPRKAAMPLLATLGGMAVPAGVYLLGCYVTGTLPELGRGWAVPAATDIAFCYMAARVIFGPGHPAIPFLLLLAIVDDAGGLIILAVFYPQKAGGIDFPWLLLAVAAVGIGMGMARMKLQSFWWYLLIPGSLCWYAFYKAGVHPALGLVPIIPTMPHAHTDLGIFARNERGRHDTLNEFEHWWKNPVEVILGLFGLVNAGVLLSHLGTPTWVVLAGLVIGKPLGITVFALVGKKVFGLSLPEHMSMRDVVVLGVVAGIGLTVALFVADAAFRGQAVLDSVKMGALFSAVAAPIAFVLAKVLRIQKIQAIAAEAVTPIPEEVQ